MLGDMYGSSNNDKGVSLMTVEKLFDLIEKEQERAAGAKQFKVLISYLEIYNEQVRDLMIERKNHLMIVEDPAKGVFVPDLKEIQVVSS